MELDKRIKSIDSIRSFNTDNIDCSGKFGYFTNYVDNFDNLDDVCKGTCIFKGKYHFPFYAINSDSLENRKFQFFIPEEDLLSKPREKKFRPYTFKEFTYIFTVGSIITFRRKAYAELIHNVMFIGYREDDVGLILLLGNAGYSLEDLSKEYEYQNTLGKWVPFGVEE